MAKSKTKNVIESHGDVMLWTERLLDLFWTVDEVMQEKPESVPPLILKAYQAAERARQQL